MRKCTTCNEMKDKDAFPEDRVEALRPYAVIRGIRATHIISEECRSCKTIDPKEIQNKHRFLL